MLMEARLQVISTCKYVLIPAALQDADLPKPAKRKADGSAPTTKRPRVDNSAEHAYRLTRKVCMPITSSL